MRAVFTVKYITNMNLHLDMWSMILKENGSLFQCHNYTTHICLPIHMGDWVSQWVYHC